MEVETLEPSDFQLNVDNYDSQVTEGETVSVTATVTNEGDETDTQTVEAEVPGIQSSDTASASLAGGESETESFSIPTVTGDAGSYTLELSSEDDSETRQVTVEEDSSGSSSPGPLADDNPFGNADNEPVDGFEVLDILEEWRTGTQDELDDGTEIDGFEMLDFIDEWRTSS